MKVFIVAKMRATLQKQHRDTAVTQPGTLPPPHLASCLNSHHPSARWNHYWLTCRKTSRPRGGASLPIFGRRSCATNIRVILLLSGNLFLPLPQKKKQKKKMWLSNFFTYRRLLCFYLNGTQMTPFTTWAAALHQPAETPPALQKKGKKGKKKPSASAWFGESVKACSRRIHHRRNHRQTAVITPPGEPLSNLANTY